MRINHCSRLGRLLSVLICLIAATSAGCRNHDRAQNSSITVLYPIDERGLGPAFGLPSQFLVFLPLVTRNAKGDLEGRLAERWEHSPDYRTWTVHLRTNVRWHDGVPVTAHDVKFTLDLLSHPDVLVAPPGAYSVRVLDDSTYTITYHQRSIFSPLDDYTVFYPRHLLNGLDPKKFYDWAFWEHPVGNGAYRYVRTVPKTMMEFEANSDYYRGKPRIQRVVLKFGDPSIAELLSGNVDAIPCCSLSPTDFLKLASDSRFQSYYFVQPEKVNLIAWNHRSPLFRDPEVRHALTLAINRRELHRVLNLPADLPVSDVFVTERQFRNGELPEPLPYDPGQAKRVLDESGWRATGDDGMRQRDGRPFRFAALVPTAFQGLEDAAVYIQAQLREVGIYMEVHSLDHDVAKTRVRAGEFEAAFLITRASGFGGLALFDKGSPIGYQNPKVIALLDDAASSVDPDETDRIYGELKAIFQTELPVTLLYSATWSIVAHRRVRGLSSPYRADPVWYMEELWVDKR